MKVLLFMIFLHIIDDFCLQKATLCDLKQKKMWNEKAPDPMYRFDYIVALIMHSFSWSFMIMIPFLKVEENITFTAIFVLNVLIHSFVDDLKANKSKINLITDQTIHICQIIITYFILG